VIVIITIGTTFCRDLSYNELSGEVPTNGSFSLFTPIRYINALHHFLLMVMLAASDVFGIRMVVAWWSRKSAIKFTFADTLTFDDDVALWIY
jgi:hypothetical protein